jgi:hypothetical protein
MILRPLIALASICALGSCGDFPKDPKSTLQRIGSEHSFRVGLVSTTGENNASGTTKQLLLSLASETHASPQVIRGETELLLTRLEQGKLDLVIGRFEKKSPWASRVTFGPPLRTEQQGNSEILLRPAAQNGENAWIGLVERKARDLAPAAR